MKTPELEYIEHQMTDCRERWFKNHKADMIQNAGHPQRGGVIIIGWQATGTWNYGCRFILHRRWLCIVGDIGEAVFEWSEDIKPEFLAGLDFHYFLSKCRASDSGEKFTGWDSTVAKKALLTFLKSEGSYSPEYDKTNKRLRELCGEAHTKDDYRQAAEDCYDETGDAEYASMVAGFGEVPSAHAIGMFVGLQMAIAQLNSKAP